MTGARVAAVLALLVLPAAASAGPVEDALALLAPPASGRCAADLQALYCADATASADVSCTSNATHFACDVSVSSGSAGWTLSGLPGQVTNSGAYEVSVCDGISDCTRDFHPAGVPCTWAMGAGGCSGGASASYTIAGPYSGCFQVYSDVELTVYADFPGLRSGLARDTAFVDDIAGTC